MNNIDIYTEPIVPVMVPVPVLSKKAQKLIKQFGIISPNTKILILN